MPGKIKPAAKSGTQPLDQSAKTHAVTHEITHESAPDCKPVDKALVKALVEALVKAKNTLSLSVQYPDPRLQQSITRAKLRRWVQAALLGPAELTIRLVDAEEGRILNRDYRGKDYATNVLTFAYNDALEEDAEETPSMPDIAQTTQADIILCTDVLQREAQEQNKTLEAHTAHLVVHGVLHAQGYEHETDQEAEEMEGLETEILQKLGIENPYQS